jgi:uridine kinase
MQAEHIDTFAALARQIADRPARLGHVRLVAIDGPGGAGKSSFAARLATALGGAPIVRTDDFASWDKPIASLASLEARALRRLADGQPARYRRYDWDNGKPGAWVEVRPSTVIILEGVSSSHRAVAGRLTLAAWLETPPRERLARGIERDGEHMRNRWMDWMIAEDEHFEREQSRRRADVVVNGAPSLAHDPDAEFVRLRHLVER